MVAIALEDHGWRCNVDRGSLGIVLMVGSAGAAISRWSGGRDLNSRSPGPKPEAKAYRIQLDLSSTSIFACKSLNSTSPAMSCLPAPEARQHFLGLFSQERGQLPSLNHNRQ